MSRVLEKTRPTTVETDPRWRAVEARDRAADGSFVTCVKTTGIYCRPSCPARHPKPENVIFAATCEEAEEKGFRACKRCKPDEIGVEQRNAEKIAAACRIIEQAEEQPTLDALAQKVGISPFHFHRLFKAATGVTPKAYAAAHRASRVRDELEKPDATVTSALYGAGFNSNGRFYATTNERLGMTPSDYRAGGRNAEIRFAIGECSLGSIIVARSDKGVCMIAIDDDPEVLVGELQNRFPKASLIGGDEEFEDLVAKVVGFVEAPRIGLDLPLDIQGTAFQQRVWKVLSSIPAGKTMTYAEVAKAVGSPKAVRAVGAACGANRLAVAIPCHRVVHSGGGLSGYRWGVERKRALLKKEGVA